MNKNLLHTPDGVRDLYGVELERKLELISRLGRVFHSYGYKDIETPTIEFFDVFGNEVGTTPSSELYKFFDREGRTLVLRPDFTPAIARAVSVCLAEEEKVCRLCYKGNTFVNHTSYQGRLKESTQMGAELIGNSSVDADAEMIAMVIRLLLSSSLTEFQISIGQVKLFDALASLAGLDEEIQEEVLTLIRNRNTFSVQRLLEPMDMPESVKTLLASLPSLFGGEEVLERTMKQLEQIREEVDEEKKEAAQQAIVAVQQLGELVSLLKVYGLERYVSFDLGMMSSYHYYTGIVFRGYTYGTGDAIVKGGRYDRLLEHFGSSKASVGFVVEIDELLSALDRQKIEILPQRQCEQIRYRADQRENAIRQAEQARSLGRWVELVQED